MRKSSILLSLCAVLASITMLATSAFAITSHPYPVPLRDVNGNNIMSGSQAAFSMQETCGTCHESQGHSESHSYHAQLAANQFFGWNNWNPDSSNPFKKGPAPKGKNWTQSPGHVGKW